MLNINYLSKSYELKSVENFNEVKNCIQLLNDREKILKASNKIDEVIYLINRLKLLRSYLLMIYSVKKKN